MTPQPRSATTPIASAIAWMLHMASWMLARSLNLPQPLVHSTGVFVYAQVQAVEHRAAKTLCLVRLRRRLQALFRQP